jgi:hypothetical protein
MKKWEDIVREKMETFNDTLPESVFAEFQARRGGAAPVPAPKRFPLVWALVPAVAAVLAAVLLLRQPGEPGEDLQVIRQPAAPVVAVSDSTEAAPPEVAVPVMSRPLVARASVPKAAAPSATLPAELPAEPETIETAELGEAPEGPVSPKATEVPEAAEASVDNPVVTPTSPFVPEGAGSKAVGMKVGQAAGIVAGGGLLAALIGGAKAMDNVPVIHNMQDPPYMDPGLLEDVLTDGPRHAFPLRAGLSVRFPVTERWSITTGLDYAMYASRCTFSRAGERLQRAHYLGIPVRLDWTLASGRMLDVYLGAGSEGDFCVAATVNGHRTRKDGFSFSLLGAGGIQFNISRRAGLYVEPTLSWTIPSDRRVLETWRSTRPLAFSVAAGVRITLGDD